MSGAGTLFALAVLASTAPGQDLELHWSAPAECPDTRVVEAQVAEALAGFEGATRPVSADAVVEAVLVKSGTAYDLQLDIHLETVTASRQIRASDCGLLAETTGLIVAVALDPETSFEELSSVMDVRAAAAEDAAPVDSEAFVPPPEAPAEPSDPPSREPEPAPPDPLAMPFEEPTSAAPPPEREPEPDTPLPPIDGALRIFGGGGAGVLPSIGGGIGLALAVTGRFWRAEVQGSHWFARRATFDGETTIGGEFSLWSGGARGCGVPMIRRLEIPLCAGAEVGQIHGQGFGAPTNLDAASLWAAIVVAPGVLWLPRPWIGLFAGVDGLVNVVRPGFKGQQRPEVHRVAPVAVRMLGGIELRIGTRVLAAKKSR